jgi:hypothetical protein
LVWFFATSLLEIVGIRVSAWNFRDVTLFTVGFLRKFCLSAGYASLCKYINVIIIIIIIISGTTALTGTSRR